MSKANSMLRWLHRYNDVMDANLDRRRAHRLFTAGMILVVVAGWLHYRLRTDVTEVFFWLGFVVSIGLGLYSLNCVLRLPQLRKPKRSWKQEIQEIFKWEVLVLVALTFALLAGVPIVERVWGQDAKVDFSASLAIVVFCHIRAQSRRAIN
jgi:formate-dependent nitrite reductase membrane component NrfD